MSIKSVLENRDQFIPLYYRIQQQLRSTIEPGDKLQLENELCAELSTTRSTVTHALSLLDYEGLIVDKVGRGTFVAPPSPLTARIDSGRSISFEDRVAADGAKVIYRNSGPARVAAPIEVLARLSLPSGSELCLLERVRVVGEQPVGFELRYLREEFGRQVTQRMIAARSAHSSMSEIIGSTVPSISVALFAESAETGLARQLNLKQRSAVSFREHVHHDREGQPLLCGRSTFCGGSRRGYILCRVAPSP